MELVKSSEKSISKKSVVILRAMFSNALVVGIVLGFFINICGISLAKSIQASVDMITAVALPAALFGMGGVLYQYRPAGCLLYTSPSPRDMRRSRMPSSA